MSIRQTKSGRRYELYTSGRRTLPKPPASYSCNWTGKQLTCHRTMKYRKRGSTEQNRQIRGKAVFSALTLCMFTYTSCGTGGNKGGVEKCSKRIAAIN